MKVLVIPDVHLKEKMFSDASTLMKNSVADKAVCLMDIADDWGADIAFYEEAYDVAIQFAIEFPQTLWCYGNHDLSYLWHQYESGFNIKALYIVQRKLLDLREVADIRYVHRIDNVLFSHGGVSKVFVEQYVPMPSNNNVDAVLDTINNKLGVNEMWIDSSPIWLRPQNANIQLYKPYEFLQVVGHTPQRYITRTGNLISTDVFSTYTDGRPIGTEEFLLLDTETWRFSGIKV